MGKSFDVRPVHNPFDVAILAVAVCHDRNRRKHEVTVGLVKGVMTEEGVVHASSGPAITSQARASLHKMWKCNRERSQTTSLLFNLLRYGG